MKKKFKHLGSATIILQIFLSTHVNAIPPTHNTTPFQISVPHLVSGFEFNVGPTYLQPAGSNLDYAVLMTPVPTLTPRRQVQTIMPDYTVGLLLGARYVFPYSGNDIQLNWAYLNTNDTTSIKANPNTQYLGPFYEIGSDALSIKQADGLAKFIYHAINVDMGQYMNFGMRLMSRFFAGLSGVYIKETLSASYQGATVNTFFVSSEDTSKFSGIGPRLGGNVSYDFCCGFGVTGQMAGALLVGKIQPNTTFTAVSPALQALGIERNVNSIDADSTVQVVPAFDAKLGLTYFRQFSKDGNFTFELGYQVATYINAIISYYPVTVTEMIQSGSVAADTIGKAKSNFSVTGPYLNFILKI